MTPSGASARDPSHDTIATRLAGFARRSPRGVAIAAGDRSISWAQLDREASGIAAAVSEASEGRRGNVCLLVPDRIDAVKALLGVARSGSAYVPFDADDPEDRLRFMLADSGPKVVLAGGASLGRARALAPAGCTVLDVAAALRHAAIEPVRVRADSVAQVYYTSGSTGQPKGVCQTHANQLHFADAYQRRVGVGEGDRQSLLYSIGYAAALGDIYRAIALGATLCPYDLKRAGIAGLADWIDREGVSLLHTFPMVFRELAKRIMPARVFPSLRVLQLDGESAYAADVGLFRAHTAEGCSLVVQLAATEITLISQNVIGHAGNVDESGPVAAGRPAEGVRVEVRRADGSAAKPGEVGELFVHSRHLSPGYWKRPDLDALAFSPDPLDPHGRTYRTGDLGRIDGGSVLHFLGRVGSRVKIRGHTVDLAEVDAALVAWPDALHAAVSAETDPDDTTRSRLVACVVVHDGARRDVAALRRFLARRLPLHMLPAAARFVAALPRTSSGKVDRERLASLPELPADVPPYSRPRDATEAAVAHLFTELLRLDRAGRDDDFFLVGGDSLMASELQERIEDVFGVRMAAFHEDATVAGIAAAIRATLSGKGFAPRRAAD